MAYRVFFLAIASLFVGAVHLFIVFAHSFKRWALGALALAAVGCAHNPLVEQSDPYTPALNVDASAFLPQVSVVSEQALFSLSEAQQEAFDEYLGSVWRRNVPAYELVFDFLENSTEHFDYQAKTFVAQDTLESLTGNCMSLAVLTTALAEHAGVNVRYQLMDSAPVFYREGDVVVKGVHVRSKLYKRPGTGHKLTFTGSSLIVDYLPDDNSRFVGNIGHEQFLALFYANRAVELMNDGDLRSAYWYAQEALRHHPDDVPALNTLAILFGRIGDIKTAEMIYQYGIEVAENKLTLLKNYRSLLVQQGRDQEAEKMSVQMARYEDPSPFGWIKVANAAYEKGDYQEARVFFKKSVEAAPYLDYGYFGLAKVAYQQGELNGAQAHLQTALEKSFRQSERVLYEAKLTALQRQMDD